MFPGSPKIPMRVDGRSRSGGVALAFALLLLFLLITGLGLGWGGRDRPDGLGGDQLEEGEGRVDGGGLRRGSRSSRRGCPVVGESSPVDARDRLFTSWTEKLVASASAGCPIKLQIGDEAPLMLHVAPMRILAPGFKVGLGPEESMAASVRTFAGFVGAGGKAGRSYLAVVNGAVSIYLDLDEGRILVSHRPGTAELVAVRLRSPGGRDADEPGRCAIESNGLATLREGFQEGPGSEEALSVRLSVDEFLELAEEAGTGAVLGGDSVEQYRLGPLYDASLVDLMILCVLDKATTGSDAAAFPAKVAETLVRAAAVSELFERQLGLRPLLQEIILNPDEPAYSDPGQTIASFLSWIGAERPRASFSWGHAVRFGVVDGSKGGVIGRTYTRAYGGGGGVSECEPQYDHSLFGHELGHNVGSNHTNGGIMNASFRSLQSDFHRPVASDPSITGATQIYNDIQTAARTYGDAPLRNPAEMPFGVDDVIATASEAILFDPLANDRAQTLLGMPNSQLSLMEVGVVVPKAAGSARVVGGDIEFIPSAGYVGPAWFTYTLRGNVGNGGSGWLHAAHVNVSVNETEGPPTLLVPSAVSLDTTSDVLTTDFTSPVRFNVLLNDEGQGSLWAGEVEARLGPSGPSADFGGTSLSLVSAKLIGGNGSLVIETRPTNQGGLPVQNPNGYLVYTPGSPEQPEVVISYTVRDAWGVTQTQRARLFDINPPSDYLSWAARFPHLASDLADPAGDCDQDSLSHLAEFAFGLSPERPDVEGAPRIRRITTSADGLEHFAYTYRRRAGGSGTTGVDYRQHGLRYSVQSADLAQPWDWVSAPSVVEAIEVGSVDIGGGMEIVTVCLAEREGGLSVRLAITHEE